MDKSKLLWVTLGVVLVAGLVWVIASAPKSQAPQSPSEVASPSAAPTPPAPGTPAPSVETKSVNIQDFAFGPTNTVITRGGKVTFTNNDGASHNVTFDTGVYPVSPLASGASVTIDTSSFPPGTYNYHCSLHPSMKGTLTVQ